MSYEDLPRCGAIIFSWHAMALSLPTEWQWTTGCVFHFTVLITQCEMRFGYTISNFSSADHGVAAVQTLHTGNFSFHWHRSQIDV